MTRRRRELDYADALVKRGLDIIRFFRPAFWFLENTKTGLLKNRPYMKGLPYVDVDYCQFTDWGYQKPTRIWGSPSLGFLGNVLCDRKTCSNIKMNPDGVIGNAWAELL